MNRPKRQARPRPTWPAQWPLFLAAALVLAGCEGSGCTPGDFMTTCARSCRNGVLIAAPRSDTCVCNQMPAPDYALARDGGAP